MRYGLLGLATVVVASPVLWTILQSFKSTSEMYGNMWGLPHVVMLENYGRAIEMGMLRYIANSAVVSVGTVVCILVAASLAAYAFSTFEFLGTSPLFLLFIFTLVVLMQAMIIPLYAVLVGLGATKTYLVLLLPYAAAGLPVSIFLLRALFDTIPGELEEAAKIDGVPTSERSGGWSCPFPVRAWPPSPFSSSSTPGTSWCWRWWPSATRTCAPFPSACRSSSATPSRRLIATLHDPAVIRKLLAHLGRAASGPSPGPAPPESRGVAP